MRAGTLQKYLRGLNPVDLENPELKNHRLVCEADASRRC